MIVSTSVLLGYDSEGKPMYGDSTVIGSTPMADIPLFNIVEAKAAALIVEHLGSNPGDVQRDVRFHDDLGADSLDMVELTMAFEDEFGVEIDDDEAAKVNTVQDAFTLIESKIGG